VIKNKKHKNLLTHTPSYARRSRPARLAAQALIIVAVIGLTAAPSSASRAGTSAASPELAIDMTRRDFGEVFVGEELDQIFTVRNVGTAPLELANKTLAARPSAPSQARPVSASSADSHKAAINYLKPAAALKRLAAPT
jgi:hypothetical protein